MKSFKEMFVIHDRYVEELWSERIPSIRWASKTTKGFLKVLVVLGLFLEFVLLILVVAAITLGFMYLLFKFVWFRILFPVGVVLYFVGKLLKDWLVWKVGAKENKESIVRGLMKEDT